MWVTDAQVKTMRKQIQNDENLTHAAMKAGMDRKTARRYRDNQILPSHPRPERTWRTRPDPFEDHWPEILRQLEEAPGLDARTLFEDLVERVPGRYQENQLRTLQRRVREWRMKQGPDQPVRFPQEHRPGEAMQTDFTVCDELGVTIAGEPFAHMLCHPVLPYSNWEWASICHSESILSLRCGVQAALRELGAMPRYHQTDHSTAATHNLEDGREFNRAYADWMATIGMEPRTTQVGAKEQNGDVESLNGALKRRLEQQLLKRGSRDFATEDDYRLLIEATARKANAGRSRRLQLEREHLQPLKNAWYPEYQEEDVRVTPWSTVRIKFNTYSVPSRLIGFRVRARIYLDRIEIWSGGTKDLSFPRLAGRHGHQIDYRHVIHSLVRKPGAFARYRYQEDLFPSLVFRRAYDVLATRHVERIAEMQYIRLLQLAADVSQQAVEQFLAEKLEAGEPIVADEVAAAVKPRPPAPPQIPKFQADLRTYDRLLTGVRA